MQQPFYHIRCQIIISPSTKNKYYIHIVAIFVVNTLGGVFVKRVRINSNGDIELISDNKIYEKEILKKDEIEIIGKVVKIML